MLATGSRNVQSYLATGESSFLFRAPAAEVPSFFPKRLRELLDTPEIRSALPPTLLSANAPHPWVEAFKTRLSPARPRLDCNRDASPDRSGRSVAARRDKTGYALRRQFGSRDC